MVLEHLGGIGDPVDRAGRRVDEPPDAGIVTCGDNRTERVAVDRCAEALVERKRRIVRNACEIDDGVATCDGIAKGANVADIAPCYAKPRVRCKIAAEPQCVVDDDAVVQLKELGYEDMPDIARAPSD